MKAENTKFCLLHISDVSMNVHEVKKDINELRKLFSVVLILRVSRLERLIAVFNYLPFSSFMFLFPHL